MKHTLGPPCLINTPIFQTAPLHCALIVWVIDLQPSFPWRDKHNDILMILASFFFSSDVIKLLQRDKNTLRNPLCKLWENIHKFMVNFPSSCRLLFDSSAVVSLPCHCSVGLSWDPARYLCNDNECEVAVPVLGYRNTEVRSPWRGDTHNGEPPWRSRLLMLDSINTNPQPAPFFCYSLFFSLFFTPSPRSQTNHYRALFAFCLKPTLSVWLFRRVECWECILKNVGKKCLNSILFLYSLDSRCPKGYPAPNQDVVRGCKKLPSVKRAGKWFKKVGMISLRFIDSLWLRLKVINPVQMVEKSPFDCGYKWLPCGRPARHSYRKLATMRSCQQH